MEAGSADSASTVTSSPGGGCGSHGARPPGGEKPNGGLGAGPRQRDAAAVAAGVGAVGAVEDRVLAQLASGRSSTSDSPSSSPW